jgi:hypothetical protein
MNCGGAAHWTLQLPQEQKTRVWIPPGWKFFKWKLSNSAAV